MTCESQGAQETMTGTHMALGVQEDALQEVMTKQRYKRLSEREKKRTELVRVSTESILLQM